jgi:hypothetical protein
MVRSLASYLVRFDEEVAPPAFEPLRDVGDEGDVREGEAEKAALEEQGRIYDAAYAAAKEAFDELLENERRRFEEQMSDERNRWINEEGGKLSEGFGRSINESIEALRCALENILEPFVARSILEALIDDFVKTIREVLNDKDNPAVQFSGPRDLLEIICARLSNDAIATTIVDDAGIEVRAKIGPTVIETRVTEWLRQIRGEE